MDPALEYVSRLGVHPDLAERLAEIGEGTGVSPLTIGEGAALVHTNGLAFAIAQFTISLAVRLHQDVHFEGALALGYSVEIGAVERERTLIL